MSISNNISTKWIIGILAVMNIALLSFILMAPGSRIKHKHEEGDKVKRYSTFLQKELNLTDAETNDIANLQRAYFKVKKEKYKKINALKKEKFAALNLETPDASKVKDIAQQIGDQYQAIEEIKDNHYLSLKTKCTSPEQLQKLEQIFKRIITREKSHGKNHKKGSGKGCR